MNVIFDEFEGQVVPIRLHTWWPNDQDCFYNFNPSEIQDRLFYYDPVSPWSVPMFRWNGVFIEDSMYTTNDEWYAFVRNTIDSIADIPSPLRFANFTHTPLWDSMYVSFDLIADDSVEVAGELRLNMVVTQWKHRCSFVTGGRHHHVFRDYVYGFSGYPITMQKGDSLHFDWAYYVDEVYWDTTLVTNLYVEDYPLNGMVQAYREVVPPEYSGIDVAGDTFPVHMEPAFPNPFSASTRIAFSMRQAGNVRLSVYTPEGRLVTDILDSPMGPGRHSAVWDGHDRSGNKMGSGIYYYRLVAGEDILTGKMILLR